MMPFGLHAIDGGGVILAEENQKIRIFADVSRRRIPLMSISKRFRWIWTDVWTYIPDYRFVVVYFDLYW